MYERQINTQNISTHNLLLINSVAVTSAVDARHSIEINLKSSREERLYTQVPTQHTYTHDFNENHHK